MLTGLQLRPPLQTKKDGSYAAVEACLSSCVPVEGGNKLKARRQLVQVLGAMALLTAFAAILLRVQLSGNAAAFDPAAPASPARPPAVTSDLRSTEVVTPTVAPAPQPGYRIYLPATFKNSKVAEQPSSIELINQALASGAINAETALAYKVYVMFHDTRLPGQYQGDDSKSLPVSSIMLDMAEKFPSLSKETQGLLAPFIMPPAYAGSWYDRFDAVSISRAAEPVPGPDPIVKTGWTTMGDQNVRVWWRGSEDKAKAGIVANALHDDIWPSLTGLMGRQPLSDQGPHPFVDLEGQNRNWGDGGDGRLDIYIVDQNVDGGGLTVAYPPGCKQRPAFIILTSSVDLLAATTHEFMHTILYSYDVAEACWKYDWLQEASATWSVDYVYPDNNFEHRENRYSQFSYPELGLFYNSGHANYIFPFYLSHKFDPRLMRTIWENTRKYGSWEAVDKAIPGGFLERWPDFAIYLWNRYPPFNDFNLWDKITDFAYGLGLQGRTEWERSTDVVLPVDLKGAKDIEYKLPAEVGRLANHYYHFTFPDPAARSVKFYNPFTAGGNPSAKVQALVKLEGAPWVRQDWTPLPFKTFCRDKKDERLEELVIIYSNSDWEPGATLDPVNDSKLAVTNIGCWRWTGTAKSTRYVKGTNADVTDIALAEGLTFERKRSSDATGGNGVWESYPTRSEGVVKWSITIGPGKFTECTGHGDPLTLPIMENEGSLQIYNYVTSGPDYRYYSGIGVTPYWAPITSRCPPLPSVSSFYAIGGWFLAPVLEPRQINADGVTATGVSTTTVGNITRGYIMTVYEWRFEAQREP